MNKIKDFVDEHKKLIFIEVLFTTIAIQNNYSYACPEEFIEIDCCRKLDVSAINPNLLYHPIKNLDDHKMLRDKLNK